ncbi:hypothetical protein AVEN_226754-1 [Araneus ventricosus]|uniref:Uncharacterized protein n=1 Tax=Araneus ventricosus TaxID=182803 RepID=A0A4Y2GF88_ARAVE|nr:hypothetical protein AVEN_226754-1 [Araneus ventricosus]
MLPGQFVLIYVPSLGVIGDVDHICMAVHKAAMFCNYFAPRMFIEGVKWQPKSLSFRWRVRGANGVIYMQGGKVMQNLVVGNFEALCSGLGGYCAWNWTVTSPDFRLRR